MPPRGVMPLARRRRLRLSLGALALLAAGVVGPVEGVSASAASGVPTRTAATAAAAAAAATTATFKDPSSAITVEVTPGDSTSWRQGDIIAIHVSGLTGAAKLTTLGTCPADMPAVGETQPRGRRDPHVIDPSALYQACGGRFGTAIPGGVGLGGDTPALSSAIAEAYGRKSDGTLDVSFRVGTGEQQNTNAPIYFWSDTSPETQARLTCDPTHPCVVGFAVVRPDGRSWFSNVTDLKIAPAKVSTFDTGTCSGLDQAKTLTASGPERLQTPLSLLDRGYCGTTSSPIPVSFLSSEIGEAGPTGVGVVGASADLAFIGSPALSATPLAPGQVAVPIAVNAAAVAQTGGISSPSSTAGQFAYNPERVPTINLAPADVAGIVLHDYPTAPYDSSSADPSFNPLGASIAGRPGNAGLAGFDDSHAGLPFTQVTTPTYGVGQNSVAVSLSDYLGTRAASAWVYPTNAYNTELKRSGKPVGPLTSFDPLVDITGGGAPHLTSQMSSINSIYSVMATKDSPNYTVADGFTSVCPLSLPVSPFASNAWATKGCVRFVVLDAASAVAVGLDLSAIGSGTAAAHYLTPTTATMQAAATAAAGKLGAKGYFATTAAGAYPMTFVEYAVVSTNALVDDACAPRTGQQKMLKDFLTYATTTGQAALPAGLAGLTPALAAQASAAIAKIGTTTVARCVKKAPVTPTKTPAPTTPSSPSPAVDPGAGGGAGGSVTGGEVGSPTSVAPTGTGGTAPVEESALASNAKEKPVLLGTKPVALQDATFSGAGRTSPVSAVVGLLVLLILVGVGAAWASGALALPGLARPAAPGATTSGASR